MDRLIYTALSGASQTLYEQQISANNLANVNTNGFRADMAMATNNKVKGGGFDTRYMAQEGASGVNDSTGVAEKTERPLDVAIQGAGYIAVQDKNGNEVYTRNGNIQQDDQGQLTIDGNLVLAVQASENLGGVLDSANHNYQVLLQAVNGQARISSQTVRNLLG